VALELRIPAGGWCPKGRIAEDGPIDSRYPSREVASTSYSERTEKNVIDPDGTLILTKKPLTGGIALTLNLAQKYKKPSLVIDLWKDQKQRPLSPSFIISKPTPSSVPPQTPLHPKTDKPERWGGSFLQGPARSYSIYGFRIPFQPLPGSSFRSKFPKYIPSPKPLPQGAFPSKQKYPNQILKDRIQKDEESVGSQRKGVKEGWKMANIKKYREKKGIAKKSASREKTKIDATFDCGCCIPVDTVDDYGCAVNDRGCVDTCMCCWSIL
jgi:hypothetical protein